MKKIALFGLLSVLSIHAAPAIELNPLAPIQVNDIKKVRLMHVMGDQIVAGRPPYPIGSLKDRVALVDDMVFTVTSTEHDSLRLSQFRPENMGELHHFLNELFRDSPETIEVVGVILNHLRVDFSLDGDRTNVLLKRIRKQSADSVSLAADIIRRCTKTMMERQIKGGFTLTLDVRSREDLPGGARHTLILEYTPGTSGRDLKRGCRSHTICVP